MKAVLQSPAANYNFFGALHVAIITTESLVYGVVDSGAYISNFSSQAHSPHKRIRRATQGYVKWSIEPARGISDALPTGGKKEGNAARHVRLDLCAQPLELPSEQRSHERGR
jgi:hypothetical protein